MRSPPLILAVDDNPSGLEIIAARLTASGYRVITATDGEAGLAAARAQQPDLILLDLLMPDMNGAETFKKIRKINEKIPVIIITGVSDDFKQFISSRRSVPPPKGYLSKPVEPEELIGLVEKLLN